MRTLDRPGLEQVARGHRVAELHSRLVPHAAADSGSGPAAASPPAAAASPSGWSRAPTWKASASRPRMRGWPQAPYKTKLETDANYKRMVHEAMKPENLAAMDVGIASHNLFDLAYGLVLAHGKRRAGQGAVRNARRHGQSLSAARCSSCPRNLLLYAPGLQEGELHQRHRLPHPPAGRKHRPGEFPAPRLQDQGRQPGMAEAGAEVSGVVRRHRRDRCRPRRAGRRTASCPRRPPARSPAAGSIWKTSRTPISRCRKTANGPSRSSPNGSRSAATRPPEIPLVIAGEEILEGRPVRECLDPSRPGVVVGRYRQATAGDIERAVECAAADPDGWRSAAAADALRPAGQGGAGTARGARRPDGRGAGRRRQDACPNPIPEVSEAVDFLEFYRDTARWWQEMPTLKARGPRAWWSWSRRGISPSPFPAAAWRRPWRRATP